MRYSGIFARNKSLKTLISATSPHNAKKEHRRYSYLRLPLRLGLFFVSALAECAVQTIFPGNIYKEQTGTDAYHERICCDGVPPH